MKIINKLRIVVLSGLITAFFSGCASMQSMSSYARTGDTVSIALGGTEESNALVEVLKKVFLLRLGNYLEYTPIMQVNMCMIPGMMVQVLHLRIPRHYLGSG